MWISLLCESFLMVSWYLLEQHGWWSVFSDASSSFFVCYISLLMFFGISNASLLLLLWLGSTTNEMIWLSPVDGILFKTMVSVRTLRYYFLSLSILLWDRFSKKTLWSKFRLFGRCDKNMRGMNENVYFNFFDSQCIFQWLQHYNFEKISQPIVKYIVLREHSTKFWKRDIAPIVQ